MDKKIPRKHRNNKVIAFITVILMFVATTVYTFQDNGSGTSYRVKLPFLTFAQVTQGEFEDYIPLRGSVKPKRTVYLDAVEGGRVDELYVEVGGFVTKGQPILALSNTTLRLDVISREAQISEQLNNLRNTRLAMERDRLDLKRDSVEINFQLSRLARLMKKNKKLLDQGLTSEEAFLTVKDEYSYYQQRLEIVKERTAQDKKLREQQMTQLQDSTLQLNKNLMVARENLDNLIIKAPLDGYLTDLSAELGESKTRGVRLGQIDRLDAFKITSFIDEFYLKRVQQGQHARLNLDGAEHLVTIAKIYPQVSNGTFEVDFYFDESAPENLRRGQNVQLKLQLDGGTQNATVLLPRGAFFQHTGGNWIFVLNRQGELATKREIKLGRRNPNHFEVLAGLTPGDEVVISSYNEFAQVDSLVIEQ